MYQELIAMLNQGAYEQVEGEIAQYNLNQYDEELAVIAATTYLNLGNNKKAFEAIERGLICSPANYELYLLLGQVYESGYGTVNQAYLCYENAEFYCHNEEDKEIILQFKENIMQQPEFSVNKLSVVILSYNGCDLTRNCIESIRKNNMEDSYEIVVVDNASTDGVQEWLHTQEDIKVLFNEENKGFPAGCNQGAKLADPEADVLFLNNDVIVYPNSFFWLRMGLYSEDKVGAAGSVTNFAGNNQAIPCSCTTDEEYEKFAKNINRPLWNPYEYKMYLIGFALLVKRKCLDSVGLFDERFTPGQFEDNDMGLRIGRGGWKNVLCHNSFIRHYGHGNGVNTKFWNKDTEINAGKLIDKWEFEPRYYTNARVGIIDCIEKEREDVFSVLEIGCGMGGTLARIHYEYPNANLKGIELMDKVVDIGKSYFDIQQGDIESGVFPFGDEKFDYIIFGDVLEHLREPEIVLKRMSYHLTATGSFICSIPNIMHISVIYPLLRGEFQYQDAGILDRTHLRFFTLESIYKMFDKLDFRIENLRSSMDGSEELPVYKEFMDWLTSREDTANRIQYTSYQYIFRARRNN